MAVDKSIINLIDNDVDYELVHAFVDGEYVESINNNHDNLDIKLELFTDSSFVFINLADGYRFKMPYKPSKIDYKIAKNRIQMEVGDSILTVSNENKNPYLKQDDAWYIYGYEWLMCHLLNEDYINNNGLERITPNKYEFTKEHPYGDLKFKEGFDCYFFDIKIKDDNNMIERPYYNIGIVKVKDDASNFNLFVLKSKENRADLIKEIITNFTFINRVGVAKNYFYYENPKDDPDWSDETKAFFHKIQERQYCNWGVFSYSIPADANSLKETDENYQKFYNNSLKVKNEIEAKWQHIYDIYPTYNHLGKGKNELHYFPLDMARKLAGGNGFNNKPVLQFSYQYTTNNNLCFEQLTPMFEIMQGKWDEFFKKLALDIKAYGKPMLFRLNNEMNTDWTSYSGIMTLLDPDIFVMTWQRLYNIFKENKVDNVIWIWNPIAVTCPYCNWGEDLCYFPGIDYMQLLGGTNYEFNNYKAEEASQKIKSFEECYQYLFNKNAKSFSTNFKVILSEFACGSGGETTGELGRNRHVQAMWVKDMFDNFTSENPADYIKQIRGAIWFNCNDYDGDKIMNRLIISNRPTSPNENYDDLVETMEEFKNGFIKQERRNKL